jgi:hypothetical protein
VQQGIKKAQDLAIALPSSFTPYKEGDLVWLEAKNLHTSHPTAKLAPRRYGPFPVTKVISHVVYQLAIPPTWKIHPVFHASLLLPYTETPEHGPNFTRPPPDLVDGLEEFEVEKILDSRRRRRQLQYLVKWKGYPDADNTWEPAIHLHAPDVVQDFHAAHPSAVRSILGDVELAP